LNTIASPVSLVPGPLVTLVLALTGENELSMGFVVRRWTQCSAGIVKEAQQPLGLAGDLGDGLGPLDAVVGREGVDGVLSVATVRGQDDLGQGPAGAGVDALGRRAKDIADHMDPASLLAGGGEDLPQRPPQPKRPVADHHHRRPHATATKVP
jgi:hypothetical protein